MICSCYRSLIAYVANILMESMGDLRIVCKDQRRIGQDSGRYGLLLNVLMRKLAVIWCVVGS